MKRKCDTSKNILSHYVHNVNIFIPPTYEVYRGVYIFFAFPLVRSFVHTFVRLSVTFVELGSKFLHRSL